MVQLHDISISNRSRISTPNSATIRLHPRHRRHHDSFLVPMHNSIISTHTLKYYLSRPVVTYMDFRAPLDHFKWMVADEDRGARRRFVCIAPPTTPISASLASAPPHRFDCQIHCGFFVPSVVSVLLPAVHDR